MLAAAVCSGLSAGCAKEKFAYNEEYTFSHITFYNSEKVSIEDLSSLCPFGVQISSVSELESFIKENLDRYSVTKTENGKTERIFLKNELESIIFYEDDRAELRINGETKTCEARILSDYRGDKTKITFSVGNAYEAKRFDFEKGCISYSLELYPDYGINYIFDND